MAALCRGAATNAFPLFMRCGFSTAVAGEKTYGNVFGATCLRADGSDSKSCVFSLKMGEKMGFSDGVFDREKVGKHQ